MSTRSSARRLLSPIEDPERLLSRRNRSEPSLLFDLEEDDMAGQAPPQGPIPDLRPMEELLQAPTDGVGDAIVVPPILANQFELKIGLLNLVTAIAFHGFENDDPHSHIRRFTKITQTVKLNNVPSDVVKLLLFPFSLEGAARTWLEKEPPNSITTWNDLVSKFVNRFFPPSKTTNLRNEITRFQQRFGETFAEAWDRFKDLLNKCPHHGFSPLHQIDTFYNSLNQSEQDSLNSAANGNFLTKNTQEALTIIENKSKVQTSRNKPQVASASRSSTQDAHITSLIKQVKALLSLYRPVNSVQNGCETCGGPHAYYECQATVFPSNTVPNPREDLKAITTWSGVTLARPSVPPPHLSSSEEVEQEPKTTTDQLPPAPVSSPVIPEQNLHQPPIPNPSRLNKDKLQDKSDIQIHNFLQMFKKLYFNINLLTNKEKLFELENTPLNENCSAVLLKKLPEKLKDTRRFLIPCDFYGLESCMALADLGAIINLMPLSVWKTLSLPELTPTQMTLELATQTVTYLAGIAEDVFVQVGKFTFPADFVVVDYDVDPRVPLILGRPFLRTAHALVDVHGEELTLRVGDEKLVFNVESTSRYPRKHGDESIHKIDILDITCEDHFHEVLNVQKSINPMSCSPTPSPDHVVGSISPSLTPFGDSDFILEEIDTFLASDDSTSPDVDDEIFDPEGDIRLIEELLNNDISNDLPPPLPVFVINETEKIKSSIDDPPDLELKDLPPHLEYAFLEGTSKLPIIIAKDLKREEKEQLLKVLKSHKRAIAWKISDIRGIDPNFCTHKILMEDDFKPAVQHQRRVNPKIHEVIKEEVIKLLDAGLIYPISDSPWVSPVHVVPKGGGGMTVVTNENNELIPTRLVTGWRVCIDYRKLNDATRKDHFPLPFMDQMLERLAGNEYYCFLDGFSGYFQIPIDPQDQEKTTFTCPYGTFAYRRMPFGLCNAPGMFQRCMVAIFYDMIEKTIEVFMDDF
ncbi:reverse transcriptase domain-containing protein [Tanacetum coccineum]